MANVDNSLLWMVYSEGSAIEDHLMWKCMNSVMQEAKVYQHLPLLYYSNYCAIANKQELIYPVFFSIV